MLSGLAHTLILKVKKISLQFNLSEQLISPNISLEDFQVE